MQDCIDICAVCSDLSARNSQLHDKMCLLCSEVCALCADSCAKINDPEMRECADGIKIEELLSLFMCLFVSLFLMNVFGVIALFVFFSFLFTVCLLTIFLMGRMSPLLAGMRIFGADEHGRTVRSDEERPAHIRPDRQSVQPDWRAVQSDRITVERSGGTVSLGPVR